MQFRNKHKVAVFMVVYNHALYIEQAIESILAQQTDFPIKIFIGEDCSTDSTREICLHYANQFPEQIELLLTERNIGGVANAQRVYSACFAYGDYTAMCEGDDFWTDPLKLQKQVDFLETHPDFAICFHNVSVIYENGDRSPHLVHQGKLPEVTTFEDLARENYIPTPSCIFRNNLFDKFPDWCLQMYFGDWLLHLLNAQHGKIKYFDEAMAVYRIHDQGAWGSQDIEKRLVEVAKAIKKSREYFYPRGTREFTQALEKIYRDLCFSLLKRFNTGDYENFRFYYRKVMKIEPDVSFRLRFALAIRRVMISMPFAEKFHRAMRRYKDSA